MRVKKILSEKQLVSQLKSLPGWKTNPAQTVLKARFSQPDYISGLVFIARVAVHAELLQHHPDITYTYNTVAVSLSTHDSGGITKLDIELAKRISTLTTS